MKAKSPIRILRIITRMNIGGPAIHVGLLSAGLDPARFCTRLVIGEADVSEGDLSPLLTPGPGFEVIRLRSLRRSLRPWSDGVSLVRLLRICWATRPQIIDTHMAKAGSLGRVAGLLYNALGCWGRRGERARLVHTFHGHVLEGYFSPSMSRVFTAIERWLGRRTDCLIAVSPAIRSAILAKGIGREARVRVIRLGVELSRLAELPLPNGHRPLQCGLVGRLVPIKNPSLFLEGLEAAISRLPGEALRGVMIGDGPLRGQLEEEASRRGLGKLVQFTGWRHDLPACYEGLDIVCLTSWNEGTPLSVIEAMAAGRAVVATDVGGLRDLLHEPDAPAGTILPGSFETAPRGLLVRSGDAQGLAIALRALASDHALRRRLGEAARAYALQTFRTERLVSEMSGLYESLLQG